MVQYCILSSTGNDEKLAPLQSEDIQTILNKYAHILAELTWTPCFIPIEFLRIACRSELDETVLTDTDRVEYSAFVGKLERTNPGLLRVYRTFVEYHELRDQPITVFGTKALGSCVATKTKNLEEVLRAQATYSDLDVQFP